MGYVVKHSTSNVNKTRRKGNVALGVSSEGYDKTATSGFYAGVPPVEGKHNFARVSEGGTPNFYSLTDEELVNFVNGLGERNLTHLTPSQGGWAGTYSVIDSDTRTFNLTTQQNNAATTSAWRTFYWNVSAYEGQTVAISADVEFISETNCTFSSFTIGQGNTGTYTIHIAGSDAADRVTINTKPTTPTKMEWAGVINATGIVGFTFWINNVTANGANSVVRVSNVQIEVNNHVTEFSSPNTHVSTVLEAQNYLLERDDIVFTDNIKNNNVTTDGLVLSLNAKIKSSFLDNEPTTNLINGGANRANGISDIWYHGNHAGCNSGDYPNEYFSFSRPHVIRVESTNSTGYGMINQQMSVNAVSGSVYTYSFDYKQIDYNGTFTPSLNVYGNGYKNPDSSNYFANLSTRNINLDDGWKRFEATYTATYTGQNTFRTNLNTDNTADFKVLFDNFQIEEGSGTTFTTSSRSQNTTWYDLSGKDNNANLINGVSYSNGGLVFDNTNDQIRSLIDYYSLATGSFTMVFSGKKTAYGSSGNNAGNSTLFQGAGNGWNGGWRIVETNTGTPGDPFSGRHSINFGSPGTGGSSTNKTVSDPMDVHRPFFYAFSLSGSTGTAFLNSNTSIGSHSYSGGVQTSQGYISYTGAGVGAWGGDIYSMQVYDKGLSLEEILQNYYGGPIVTDGLVYAMDAGNLVSYESGSTIAYSMTGSISGSLNNGVAYTDSKGGVWTFDGSNDKITSSAPLSSGASTYTIEAFFKPDSQKTQVVWEQNTSTLQNGKRVCMILISDGDGGFNGQSADRHDHMPYTVGEWHHWVITVDNNLSTNKIKMYANGQLINQGNPSNTLNAGADSASIGSKVSTNSEYFDGDIGVVRVYNRVLTPSEALQNYNAQKARFI